MNAILILLFCFIPESQLVFSVKFSRRKKNWLDQKKLNGIQASELFSNMRKNIVLEKVLPEKCKTHVQHTERNAYEKHDSERIDLMLATMKWNLQKQIWFVNVTQNVFTKKKKRYPERGSYKRRVSLIGLLYSIVRRSKWLLLT